MTKIPFAKVSTLPGFPLLEDKRTLSEKAQSKMLERTTSKKFVYPLTRIENGDHPFKAWREEMNDEDYEIASALGLSTFEYMDIEEGFQKETTKDIISFCMIYDILPNQLCSDSKAFTPAIRDAMIFLVNPVNKIPLSKDKATVIRSALIEEGREQNSLEKFRSVQAKTALNVDYIFVNDFINKLTAGDGKQWARCFDKAEDFIAAYGVTIDTYHKKLTGKAYQLLKSKENTLKDVNILAAKLYHSNDMSWSAIQFSMERLRKEYGTKSAIEIYSNKPQSIGRDEWPDKLIDYTTAEGAYIGGWKKGHSYHANLLARYYETSNNVHKTSIELNRFSKQKQIFNLWVNSNIKLVQYFCNRQIIMNSPGFSKLKPIEFPKLTKR